MEMNAATTLSFAFMMAFLVVGFGLMWGRAYVRFLTWRYLTRRFMSYLTVAAIGFGVAVLVVVPSVMNGFSVEFRKKVRGTLSDLMVYGARPFSFPAEDCYLEIKDEAEKLRTQQSVLDQIYREMRAVPGIAEVSPYVENPALYKHRSRIDYCFVRGVDPVLEAKVSKFEDYLLSPREAVKTLMKDTYDASDAETRAGMDEYLESLSDKVPTEKIYKAMKEGRRSTEGEVLPGVLVGIYFMRAYDLALGDVVELTTASDSKEVSENARFVVVGTFQSGFYEQDRRKLYVSLSAAQDFTKIGRRVSGISVKCSEGQTADALRGKLGDYVRQLVENGKFPYRAAARTWEEKDQNLLRAVAMEKLLIRIITSLIVISILGSIFVVLLMSVREKARDLGILKALGGSTAGVLKIYLAQGVVMAFLGALAGLVFGVLVADYLNEIADFIHRTTGWHPFPPDVYYLDRIPVRIEPAEVFQHVGLTIMIALILAAGPGLWAANLNPIEAVRYE